VSTVVAPVGVKVVHHARRVTFEPAAAVPRALVAAILDRIAQLLREPSRFEGHRGLAEEVK
jgi:hypothetical protein